jgi:putative FmdB family regulatory protein
LVTAASAHRGSSNPSPAGQAPQPQKKLWNLPSGQHPVDDINAAKTSRYTTQSQWHGCRNPEGKSMPRSTAMPIYEFHCENCDEDFEIFTNQHQTPKHPCPFCDSPLTTRLISLTHYRNADHWEKDMLGGIAKAKEKDQMKAEMKAEMNRIS